jgi:hypothetical protein
MFSVPRVAEYRNPGLKDATPSVLPNQNATDAFHFTAGSNIPEKSATSFFGSQRI